MASVEQTSWKGIIFGTLCLTAVLTFLIFSDLSGNAVNVVEVVPANWSHLVRKAMAKVSGGLGEVYNSSRSNFIDGATRRQDRAESPKLQRHRPLILIWTGLWRHDPNKYWTLVADECRTNNCAVTGDRSFLCKPQLINNCAVTGDRSFLCKPQLINNCAVTGDRSFLSESDAVMFYAFQKFNPKDLPPTRRPEQFFVYFNPEAAPRTQHISRPHQSYFNWTMTYRTDSDVLATYGVVEKISYERGIQTPSTIRWLEQNDRYMGRKEAFDKLIQGKTSKIAWIVGNCRTQSGREHYVAQLQKHIKVDKYGKCGGAGKCGVYADDGHNEASSHYQCMNKLKTQYKFYLSFENNVCQDYVTEKFFERAAQFVIPIVLCRETHAKVAKGLPFIAADDFQSPKHLANHLHYLDSNITAYKEYFNYRKKYEIRYRRQYLCDLCRKLWNKTELKPKVVPNIEQWWHAQSKCKPNYGGQQARKGK